MHDWDYYQRLSEGDIKGWIMPLDDEIGALRRSGLSLDKIAAQIGKRKSYVQNRLFRIATREEV